MRKIILALLCVAAVLVASAQDAPLNPMVVSGKVLIDGKEAPAGTKIRVVLQNTDVATYLLTKDGDYSITIPGRTEDAGENVYFTVNKIAVLNVLDLKWNPGEAASLTLSISTPTTTVKANVKPPAATSSTLSSTQAGGSNMGLIIGSIILLLLAAAIISISNKKKAEGVKQ